MISMKEAYNWGNEAVEVIKAKQSKQKIKFCGQTIEVNKHEVIDFNLFKNTKG